MNAFLCLNVVAVVDEMCDVGGPVITYSDGFRGVVGVRVGALGAGAVGVSTTSALTALASLAGGATGVLGFGLDESLNFKGS